MTTNGQSIQFAMDRAGLPGRSGVQQPVVKIN